MSRFVFLDLETRSRCNIKQSGGNVYVRDDSTELLCGVAVIVNGAHAQAHLWSPHESILKVRARSWHVRPDHLAKLGFPEDAIHWTEPKHTSGPLSTWLLSCAAAGFVFVGHNAEGFDRPALERWGLPTDVEWIDTAHKARQVGLPAGLDAIGKALFDLGKDTRGSKVLALSYKPHKKTGEFVEPDGARMGMISRYCARDVLLMAAAFYDESWGEPHADDAVREVHCKIDRRGVPADLLLANRLLQETLLEKDKWLLKAAQFGLDETTLRSSVALPKWLKAQGWNVENVQKATLQRVLEEIEPSHENHLAIVVAIEARLAFNRVTEGKALAVLRKTCPDGRMRGTLVYWGAHTGRWAGRGMQLQNLPAPCKGFSSNAYDPDIPTGVSARLLEVSEADVLASMLRGVLIATPGKLLAMIDYSQIEARVLLWLARDNEGLQVFRDELDIYRVAASGIYKVAYDTIDKGSLERKVGKVATLALGFQGGPGALTAMADAMGLNLVDEGVDPEETVNAWRDSNTKIAGARKGLWRTPEGKVVVTRKGGLWKEIKAAAIAAIKGLPSSAARCHFEMPGDHLLITLPSGRPLVYRNARYENWENAFGGTSKAIVFDAVRYGKVNREATYGGRLAENITQAVARDVMGHAMVELEAEGLHPLFTVHDEVVVEIDDASQKSRVVEVMTTAPQWAEGLPLKAEGEVDVRYGK